jgi:alpha-beta hydrolase superfamily lysophospholipase
MHRALALTVALLTGCSVPADWGANALLHPSRRASVGTPAGAQPFSVEVAPAITLHGWLMRGVGRRRGLILWLHGVGDNKDAAASLAARYTPHGFDVAAYDARAHGESGGDVCTYGFYEKRDVARVLDVLAASGADAERTILFGHSMGAAVALQAAPLDARVRAVIAGSPFATLAQAVQELKPAVMSRRAAEAGQRLAEERARFRVDDVAPELSARALAVPLLLLHGRNDRKLSVENSRRILRTAAPADKMLIELPGVGHDDLLAHEATWSAVGRFLDRVSP